MLHIRKQIISEVNKENEGREYKKTITAAAQEQ